MTSRAFPALHKDQNLLLRLAYALIHSLPVFQMHFALVEVEIARIKPGPGILSEILYPMLYIQLSSRYIWFPSCASALLHYISCCRL